MSGRQDTPNPITRPAIVDHEARTVTFAVTFAWEAPWALDHCEVATLRGSMARALRDGLALEGYGPGAQVATVTAVETWEPREERHIGGGSYCRPFAIGGAR